MNEPLDESSLAGVLGAAIDALDDNSADVPMCVVYDCRSEDGGFEQLAFSGVAPESLPPSAKVREAIAHDPSEVVDGLEEFPAELFGNVELVPDDRPDLDGVVWAPIWDSDSEDRQLIACLVMGLSRQLAFDGAYRDFLREIWRVLSEKVQLFLYRQLQLAYAERKYEAVFENAMDAKMLTAPDGRILEANPAACELLGYTREEFRELGRTGVADPEDERLAAALEARSKTGRFRRELNLIHRDGHPIPCEVSSQTYRDADGHERTSVVIRDQRERLDMESRLRQAQKLDVVGKLAGGIAHDFNNLLTAIDASARFLEASVDQGSEAAEDVAIIRAASDRASALTRRLLTFSRQRPVRPSSLDLVKVISEIDPVLRSLLTEDIEVVTHVDPNPSAVYASRQQIEQILLNLVVNARDAMKRGGTLTIEVSDRDVEEPGSCAVGQLDPGTWVCMSVTDTGSGLPDMDSAHLFEPFFTTKSHGTGLGLATVADIVSDRSGAIVVQSEPGAGTRFEVYLPATTRSEPTDEDDAHAPTAATTLTGKVLVVEDQPLVRRVTSKMLDDAGFDVTSVADGGEAISLVEEAGPGTFDLVVSDVVMPHLGGEETARRLALLDPDLKFLFVSGYADNDSLSVLSEVASEVLLKPYTAAQLLERVERVLDEG